MASSNNSQQHTVSYDHIRTNNEEDTQHFSFRSSSIHSIDELRNEMQKIGTNIETVKTNWNSRVQSIQQLGHMIHGGILDKYPQEFIDLLFNFRDGICTQITELRSGVTKEIYRVLSYLAVSIDEHPTNDSYLKEQIQPFIDYIIPYILKQTKQTILIISHGSNLAARTIIKRIPICKSIQHILTNTNVNHQKAICLRVRCIEYIQIIIETQAYHHHYCDKDIISKMMSAIIHCISDPHPSVRYVARLCVWSLNHMYPNHDYSSIILDKISAANSKYVMSEKMNYKMFPPPIGKGHKVELGAANRGISHLSHDNNHDISNNKAIKPNKQMRCNRPKSALPSRTHRLELLKKKKREMANKLRKNNKQNERNDADIIVFPKRPQTAHVTSSSINGQAFRVMHSNNNNNNNSKDDGDIAMMDLEDDNRNNIRKLRKISIMGNATRFSMSHSPDIQHIAVSNTSSKPMRIETEPQIAHRAMDANSELDAILMRINQAQIDGVRDLTKWLQTNDGINYDVADIMMSLNGFIDALTMNKHDANDAFIECLAFCISAFISSCAPNISIKEILSLLSKYLRLCIKKNCTEYQEKYNENTQRLDMICKALLRVSCDGYSFTSLLHTLSQMIIKPKQKIIWLHFVSLCCKESVSQSDASANDKALKYLFGLLSESIMNPQFTEYHTLFRWNECLIIDDILTFIIAHHKAHYHDLFSSELNDVMIETVLGTIKNQTVIHVLQKYYTSNAVKQKQPQPFLTPQLLNDKTQIRHTRFTTPSHQNKRYQMLQKATIESMATPPLNMYMSTPSCAPYNNQKENQATNHTTLKTLSDMELVNVLLTKNNKYIKCVYDEKNALKYLSHRINGNKVVFEQTCGDILLYATDVMNGEQFVLHRNALRILQAICWFYPKCVNQNIEKTLYAIVNLFRKAAPEESGELALDVITQFCKIVNYKLCMQHLLPIIENEIEQSDGRKVFAALSIFDRIAVLAEAEWLKSNINEFTTVLIKAYKSHREPMRSLIYLSILLGGETTFLNDHFKEQKIVEMMSKETDFTDWVKSHRNQAQKR